MSIPGYNSLKANYTATSFPGSSLLWSKEEEPGNEVDYTGLFVR
jgi:hypothetical protein